MSAPASDVFARSLFVRLFAACIALAAAHGIAAEKAPANVRDEFMPEQGIPYAAFDRLDHTTLHQDQSSLVIGFAPGQLSLPKAVVLEWVQHASSIVARYYGRFPVASVRIVIVPVPGGGVRGGTTWAYRGAAIRILLGDHANADDLHADWKLIHEMVHLALPNVDERHAWLSEGLATYIEPVARVQAGDLSAAKIWSDMVADMPKGLPGRGDAGLDNSSGWAQTYWGGALFCLLADIDIRKRTANRLGLQDAMRGVLAAGGNHEQNWALQRVLQAGDQAVGIDSLEKLYSAMAMKSSMTNLDALWQALGVRKGEGSDVTLVDDQSFSNLRRAITAPPRSIVR